MITRFCICLWLFAVLSVFGEELKEAKVTAVINQVNLLPNESSARKAAVNDEVRRGMAVRTGVESRSELTFTDQTIARLGANTLFSFEEGTRHMDLGGGAMLLRVPKNAGGAKISTAAVTAAITGTTVMLQYDSKSYAKFIVLEGEACLSIKGDSAHCQTVKAGQLLTVKVNPPPSSLPAPVDVDLKKLTESSALLSQDFGPLPSLDLITQAIQEQESLKEEAASSQKSSNQNGTESFDEMLTAVDQKSAVDDLASPPPTPAPTAPPGPTPDQFGSPQTITAPNPYVINTSSVIKTDPSIITNGQTDYGNIYRDPPQDGSRAAWLFVTTSDFDTASGFEGGVDTGTFLNNVAVFKFTNLQLAGDPIIDTSNNGLTSLGLIGVDGLSTNAPPGVIFHFNGIHTLLLATQQGPLSLGAGTSFTGTDRMFVYARGEGSALTLASNVTTNNDLRLYSEGAVNLSGAINTLNFSSFSGGDLMSTSAITAPGLYINSLGKVSFTNGSANAGDFNIFAQGDVLLADSFTLHALNIQMVSDGDLTWAGGVFPAINNSHASVVADATGALHLTGTLEVEGGLSLRGQNDGITVDGGVTANLVLTQDDTGDLSLVSDRDIAIAGALSLQAELKSNNSPEGTNILVAAGPDFGGTLNAASVSASIKVDSNYSLGGDARINFISGGDMTTNGAMNFVIDDSGGGQINGFADLFVIANNLSTHGHTFNATINNNAGNITSSVFDDITASTNFSVGDLTLQILNSDTGSAGTPGSINGVASLSLNVGQDLIANSLTATIDSRHRGSIGNTVDLVIAAGTIAITHDLEIVVTTSSGGSGGGTVGSTSVSLFADRGDISVGGFLAGVISTNGGGEIRGNATLTSVLNSGNISANDGILFTIEDTGFGNPNNNIVGGHIDGSAAILVQAGNIITTSDASGTPGTDPMAMEFSIYSNVAGTIGRDAIVSVNASGISAPGTIFFTVANGNYQNLGAGMIGGNATIDVLTNNLSSGDLFAEIYNYGGASIGGSATVALNLNNNLVTPGALDATGDVFLTIDNHAGHITDAADISLETGSLMANSITATIDNSNNGQVGDESSITSTISGNASITTDATYQIFGVQTPASTIAFDGGNYTVGGTFLSKIEGNGTMIFDNTSISADVIKAGIFGSNGTLRIGGGTISANTLLQLYAPGSSGLIEFVANTTLSNASAAIVLAANTVTIDNNVHVTISGPQMALVYTNNANYTGSGGNSSTTGMFIGNAVTHLLSEAPPFDETVPAQDVVYSGAQNGNWSNAAVWNPMVVPNNGNNGQNYNATISSGILQQDIAAGVIIERLTMNGGTLRLTNPLTLNAGLDFNGGAINSGILNIAGTSTQSAQMNASGLTINNSSDYTFEFDATNIFSVSPVAFNNSGTLHKNTGTGLLVFNAPLQNSGAISSESGSFRLAGGGSSSGDFSASSGAVLEFFNNYSLTSGASISGAGLVQLDNNSTLNVSGAISLHGNLRINSTGNFTDLTLTANTAFSGNGRLTLVNADRVRGSGVLSNSSTIEGETSNTGSLGTNEIGIVNQAAGLIDANVTGLILNVDPNASAGLTNAGLMRASNGGLLLLNGSGGGSFQNNGTITALDGSEVQLTNGATISGGTLTTVGSGVFRTLNNGTLDSLTNAGTFIVTNNTSLTLSGNIVNTGNLLVDSRGNFTDLFINGAVTLTGSGALTLQNAARVRGSGTLYNGGANGEPYLIQGETSNSGSLGTNELAIVNRSGGLINANVAGLFLLVDPRSDDGLINLGTMEASNGGFLRLTGNGNGVFDNTGGVIRALDASEVQLTDGVFVVGGTLATAGSGVIRTLNTATLQDLTNTGFLRVTNNTSLTLSGSITDTGNILVDSQGNFTDLFMNGAVTLTGSGTLTLRNAARVRGNGTLLNGGANGEAFVIQGETSNSGSLGTNELGIVNRSGGLIDANVSINGSGLALVVDPNATANLTNTGTMRASNGGILQLTGNGGGTFNNTGGLISALDASQVQLINGATINGGTLSTSGTGTFHNLNIGTLNAVTNTGAFIVNNNTTLNLMGAITNSGDLRVDSRGNFTDLSMNGDVTLSGAGTLTLVNAARVRAASGNPRLTNSSGHTIRGETSNSGSLGTNELALTNQGIIDANVSGLFLLIDPAAVSNAFLNANGTVRATGGGIIRLTGNGGGIFDNTSGQIIAFDLSEVQLTAGASLTGGLVATQGTGVIRVLDTATLSNLQLAGNFISNNNTSTTFSGAINNTGNITINSTGNFTDLFAAGVTLTGGGTLFLKNADRVRGSGVLTIANQTVSGETSNSGSLGNNELSIVNQGGSSIRANVNGLALNVDPSSVGLTNTALMVATNGGILLLNGNGGGSFENTGGQINGFDTAQVQLTNGASVHGGSLFLLDSSVLRVLNTATLSDVLIQGTVITNNGTTTTLAGAIQNDASFTIQSTGNFTDLTLSGNVSLSGFGSINLTNADRVRGSGILTNSNRIVGETNNSGSLGTNEIGIVNQSGGVIDANVNGLVLNVDPNASSGLTNAGTMRASNGGILQLNGNGGGDFDSSGTIAATGGGVLRFNGNVNNSGTVDVDSNTLTATGTYTQTAGTFRLAGGSVQSNNALNFQGGLVDARGTISSAIMNNANLRPALGGSGLQVTGNVSLLSASQLTFQLGGLTQGSQYGFLNVNGNVSLGGQLLVSFVNGFQNSVTNSNNFTVLSSTATLSGVFANVASGSRLTTTDSSGSFLVNYNGNTVVLSDYTAASPRPAKAAAIATRSLTPPAPARATLQVKNSSELLQVLENAAPAVGGKVVVRQKRVVSSQVRVPANASVRDSTVNRMREIRPDSPAHAKFSAPTTQVARNER